jgi:hypothetical protein
VISLEKFAIRWIPRIVILSLVIMMGMIAWRINTTYQISSQPQWNITITELHQQREYTAYGPKPKIKGNEVFFFNESGIPSKVSIPSTNTVIQILKDNNNDETRTE